MPGDRAEPKRLTDHEILEAIESAIMKGIVFWDGVYDENGECPFSGKRPGISLMGGSRSLRKAVEDCLG